MVSRPVPLELLLMVEYTHFSPCNESYSLPEGADYNNHGFEDICLLSTDGIWGGGGSVLELATDTSHYFPISNSHHEVRSKFVKI
jgi:hypothetical protein